MYSKDTTSFHCHVPSLGSKGVLLLLSLLLLLVVVVFVLLLLLLLPLLLPRLCIINIVIIFIIERKTKSNLKMPYGRKHLVVIKELFTKPNIMTLLLLLLLHY